MMRETGRGLNWPFLGMLFCLFVLSVTAPRSWERVARQKPLGELQRPQALSVESRTAAQPAASDREPSIAQRVTLTTETSAVAQASLPPSPPAGPVLVSRREPKLVRPPVRPQGPATPPHFVEPRRAYQAMLMELVLADLTLYPLGDTALDSLTVRAHSAKRVAARPEPLPTQTKLDLGLELNPVLQLADDDDGVESDVDPSWTAGEDWEAAAWVFAQLEALSHEPRCTDWAHRTAVLLRHYMQPECRDNFALRSTLLEHLRAATDEVSHLTALLGEGNRAVDLRRVRHALQRRVDVWELVSTLRRDAEIELAHADRQRLARSLAEFAAATSDSEQGQRWRDYLLIDALHGLGAEGPQTTEDERKLAQLVLRRLHRSRMSGEQRRFVNEGPLASLDEALRDWAAEPVDWDEMLRRIEAFERSRLSSAGRLVAAEREKLAFASTPEARQLAERIEMNYRNCNLRMAVSGELLSMLLPEQKPTTEMVHESILGMPVRGQSTTTTDLNVRLVPDDHRLRVALEASGLVATRASSTSGPATVFTDAHSRYQVRRVLEFTPEGLHLRGPDAEAEVSAQLRGVRTDFDGIPLLRSIARSVVEQKYHGRREEARRELQRKIAARAVERMALESQEPLARVNNAYDEHVRTPLAELGLEPTLWDLKTTEQRLVMRVRLATDDQLAAHTPRPRAPSDSLFSLQLHESAINNLIEQLDLNGRQFSVPDLHRWIAHKLNRPEPDLSDSRHDETYITFAQQDAIQILCEEDHVRLTLTLAEVRSDNHCWKDFQVRVFYRPEAYGLRGELVRDGTIQLIGYGLGVKGQVALRGVFSRMFSKERRWSLVPERLIEDERLGNYEVTQFVIDDGWIGLALGPRRSDRQINVARGN